MKQDNHKKGFEHVWSPISINAQNEGRDSGKVMVCNVHSPFIMGNHFDIPHTLLGNTDWKQVVQEEHESLIVHMPSLKDIHPRAYMSSTTESNVWL